MNEFYEDVDWGVKSADCVWRQAEVIMDWYAKAGPCPSGKTAHLLLHE